MANYFAPSTQGFYFTGLHGDSMPSDAVEIQPDQQNELMAARSSGKVVVLDNGQLVAVDPAPPSLADLKIDTLRTINSQASTAVNAISSSYPQFEIDTWDAQENEARAWLLDNNIATPTLTPIANARGLTIAELAERVIAKAEIFRPLVATIIGKRQALEDLLNAAQSESDIAAVVSAAIDPMTWSNN